MQEGEAHAIEDEVFTPAARVPGDALSRELVQELIVLRIGHLFARLDDQARPEPIEHGRNPTEVVGVRMRDKRYRELADAMAGQERNDNASSRIVVLAPGSGVDQHPVTGGGAKQRTVTLPYVKKM
jgi:hypothetical protein